MEFSDEEVLEGYESSSDEDQYGEAEEQTEKKLPVSAASRRTMDVGLDDSADGAETDDEDALETWGASKRDYYNQDEIEDEEDAAEEEAEARRLQQKRLKNRTEADFGFDDSAWLDEGAPHDAEAGREADDGRAVTEVLPQLEITGSMGAQERLRILNLRHPEFGPLSHEFIRLQPLYADLKVAYTAKVASFGQGSDQPSSRSILSLKFHSLSSYLGALSMYFAILTSTAEAGVRSASATGPPDLKDHPIMERLLACRQLWERVKDVTAPDDVEASAEEGAVVLKPVTEEDKAARKNGHGGLEKPESRTKLQHRKRQAALEVAHAENKRRLAEKIRQTEEELAGLSAITNRIKAQQTKDVDASLPTAAGRLSDFGEESVLNPVDAAEKARKKKTLRFYTSQIAQKANKRSNAGRDAGGDVDLPYRERLKDRQARLNAEAEKRGMRNGAGDASESLGRANGQGDDEDGGDVLPANKDRKDSDEEYYDLIVASKKKKQRRGKADDASGSSNAHPTAPYHDHDEAVGPDGKRAITYQIEKNKGLTPHRRKDVRNPRVKKRKKFAEKQKKLRSVRQVYGGGEQRGGYKGEMTGIKTKLVKSVKL